MFSTFKRLGSTACRVQFKIDLHELVIFESREDITLLCVQFERKTKLISSATKLWTEKNSPSQFTLEEDLNLTVTLYKNAAGHFLPKVGRIILKGHSKVTHDAVTLGFVNLKLHSLATNFSTQRLCMQVKDIKGKDIASISSSVTAKYLGDITGDDDMSSMMSGDSDSGSLSSNWGIQHGYKEVSVESSFKIDSSKAETDKLRRRLSLLSGNRSEVDLCDAISVASSDSAIINSRPTSGKLSGMNLTYFTTFASTP